VPATLPAGIYDIDVGLAGGTPWTDVALVMGAGVTDPGNNHHYKVGTLTVGTGGGPPSTTRVDPATPTTYTSSAGSPVAITLNWYRMPMPLNYLQFMFFVNASGQQWSVDDHGTTSATWAQGPFTETRTVTVPATLAPGTYDICVGLAGGTPWTDVALVMGAGVTDPGSNHHYKVGTLTVGGGP
jgi:hypothetical protein